MESVSVVASERRGGGSCVRLLGQDVCGGAALERQATGEHCVGHDAEGIDIAAPVDVGAAGGLFGGHVVRRSDDAAPPRHGLDLADGPGHAEVGEQGSAGLVVEEDVVGLYVAVDDALAVGVIERVGDLGQDAAALVLGELPVAAETSREGLAADIAHDEVGHSVQLAEGVERDDVRVRQLGGRLGLAAEAVVDLGRAGFGLDDLDGDFPVEREIARQIDGAHPASAQEPDETVLALELLLQRCADRISLRRLQAFLQQARGAEALRVVGGDRGTAGLAGLPVHGPLLLLTS